MSAGTPRYWWLSFVDRAGDGDESVAMHLGCAIVMATSLDDAVHEAWSRRVNPGGEVAGQPLRPGIFRSPAAARRFTCRLLEGADVTEAQLAIEREEAALPPEDEDDHGVCWQGTGAVPCRKRHDAARFIYYGRCRSGKRWFWFAGRSEDTRYRGPHCDSPVCLYGGPHDHGKADSEEEAVAAARAAVERLADGRPAVAEFRAQHAASALRHLNAWERNCAVASAETAAGAVEYLYAAVLRVSDDWSRPDTREVVKFRILKKTAKRVYYVRRDHGGPDVRTGFADRLALERDGEVSRRGHWWEDDFTLYATREAAEEALGLNRQNVAADGPDLQRLRRAMADAHPDRGGSAEEFTAARARYEQARREAS